MFINKDNTLRWKWIIIGAVITLLLVIIGLSGADAFIYSLIHQSTCNQWLTIYSTDIICSFCKILSSIFSTKVWIITSLLCVLIGIGYKFFKYDNNFRIVLKRIQKTYAFYIFCSVCMATAITGILKVIIGRSRPILFDGLGQMFFIHGTFNSIFNSMPSGHATASFAGLVMLGMLKPNIKCITWGLAIIIGLSRIYIGAHWPSDVLLGAFIGMVSADIVLHLLRRNNNLN